MVRKKVVVERPKDEEMCPPGFHIVHGHNRLCKNGTNTWVDTHQRKNRGKQIKLLLKENLLYLFWNSQKNYPNLRSIVEFPERDDFDKIIQFWLEYWRKQGHDFDLDPLLIKAMIAKESSFNPKAKPNQRGSTARGLMQVLSEGRMALAGQKDKNSCREVKSDYMRVSPEDLEDPVCGIAAGTRWLVHKYEQEPKSTRTPRRAVRAYHSRNDEGDDYATDVFDRYEKSRR